MKVASIIGIVIAAVVAGLAGLVIGIAASSDPLAQSRQYQHPELGWAIHEGAATDLYLWLLGETGRVVRFDRRTGDREIVAEGVRDILADGTRLWALSVDEDGGQFQVRDLRDASAPRVSEDSAGDVLLLFTTAEGVGVLTADGAYRPVDGVWRRQAFERSLEGRGSHVAATSDGSLHLGSDFGEFGGRLERIDLTSGEITSLGDADQDPCEADFDPGCDPIVGVLPDRDAPDCITAASSRRHMGMTTGRVYRVCGDDIALTYETPLRPWWVRRSIFANRYLGDLTHPLTSLVETRTGWVAMGEGRYFQMQNGSVQARPMPDFRRWSDLRISAERDGVLILVAACCAGPALSQRYWPIAVAVMD